jgi:hypothetical protein
MSASDQIPNYSLESFVLLCSLYYIYSNPISPKFPVHRSPYHVILFRTNHLYQFHQPHSPETHESDSLRKIEEWLWDFHCVILDIPPLSLKQFLCFLWNIVIRSWNIALGVHFSCEVESCAVKRGVVPRPAGPMDMAWALAQCDMEEISSL